MKLALPPSPLEPEILQLADVSGCPIVGVRIPEFISRDGNEYLWHVVRALDKLRNELIERYWVRPDTDEHGNIVFDAVKDNCE